LYPETRPRGEDDARALREAIHVFNARFETQRVDTREDRRWGASSTAQWERLKAIYLEQGLIQGTVDVGSVFTNALVDDINRFDQPAVIRQAREAR
jgi:NitT/TauT family transport system substrate-binding protein